MPEGKDKLEITVRYKDIKQTISGSPDAVTRAYFDVINKMIPGFEIVSDLFASPNILEIANRLRKFIALYGKRVVVLRSDIGTEDSVSLALIGKYIGFRLNRTNKDTMTLDEIIDATGKRKNSIVATLGRLAKSGALEEISAGEFRMIEPKVDQYTISRLPKLWTWKITDFTGRNQKLPETTQNNIAFTIGYESQSLDGFLKILKDKDVQLLIDVRKDPYSKFDTSFSEGILSKIVLESKIRYIHIPELGVDYNERQKLKESHDYESYFKLYSDYLDKNPDLVSLTQSLLENNNACLMCYEKDYRRCHRMILADKLNQKGFVFVHL